MRHETQQDFLHNGNGSLHISTFCRPGSSTVTLLWAWIPTKVSCKCRKTEKTVRNFLADRCFVIQQNKFFKS